MITATHPLNILVVEDNPSDYFLFEEYLGWLISENGGDAFVPGNFVGAQVPVPDRIAGGLDQRIIPLVVLYYFL